MFTLSFDKLGIWQLSRMLSNKIYKVTSAFPWDELYGLTSQLRRAAVTVSSNIAEGYSRLYQKDKTHFIETTYFSLMEVMNQLIILKDLDFLTEEELYTFRKDIGELSNQINAFHKSIQQ
ncbi:MAG: four helix bundle protein [Chlorobi bacterium]|nr:four helix bundle protein [Chlorobiota bacterium]